MRILVLSNLYPPDFIGGYELGCRQVVDALLARGHEVRVLTTAPRTPVPPVPHVRRTLHLTDIWNQYCVGRSNPLALEMAEVEALQINAFNVHSLITELEEFRPDVVYLWMLTGLGGLGLVACLQYLRVPWVWHLMDDVPLQLCRRGAALIPALAHEFERQIQGAYLACSQQVVNEIQNSGIRLSGDVEIIPNWVVGHIPAERSAYLPEGKLRIVNAGQLARHKGVDLVIKAAQLLRHDGYDNFTIDIYGNVPDNEISDLVRRHNLGDCVAFQGVRTQAELMRLYGQYDVFAFPTWAREPFAFAPLEAAANGCVPIMSQLCGNSEWFVHRVHCLKIERTTESLARALREVLDGRVDLESLGRRVSTVVRRDFHLEALLPRIERALARAAKRPRTGGGTAAEAYRMALLAEKLAYVLIQESARAA